jgi:ABC-type transport system involved in cytochrome c biogenesis permease subunit
MFCNIGGEDTQTIITFAFLLVPTSLYSMGLIRGKKGYYFFLSGMAFHLLSIVFRGLVIGSIPLTEKHDTISFMAFSMALIYLYLIRKKEMKDLDIIALPLIALFMFISFVHMPINTISPFLRTLWFYLHTFFYFSSYGFFGISSCIGSLYLFSGDNNLEPLQYKVAIYGWILFSISLVAGSIWFFVAHGTYWLWTSKELWTTLTWFFYGLYLHARLMKGLRGRPAAVLGISGFAVALFTYFGVGTVIPSPPTQF